MSYGGVGRASGTVPTVRLAGAAAFVLAFLLGMALVTYPTQITVLGTTVNCGAPAARILQQGQGPTDGSTEQILETDCNGTAVGRLIVSFVVWLLFMFTSAGLFIAAWQHDRRQEQANWWWDGYRWVPPWPPRR